MKPDPWEEADRWLRQAENDLAAGESLATDRRFSAQACFYAQQAAEKALKAFVYYKEGRLARTHLMTGTSGWIGVVIQYDSSFRKYLEDAGQLDQYYIPTRYPNALPHSAPYEVYAPWQAQEALAQARGIVGHVRQIIPTPNR